ncbi:serine/threonine-protein kinase [Roseisolibacter sp. H3M3-2]|uniref:serine/threonine-protein kinase n=1 Tax=Roseisolibacter sp. H3M3-2 TaxID=3031323 RepID=UPI0023DAF385|nr:serine/threonine-protein kinase [Roseisolibacter sp. H3M3-2]MDF1504807.1 serine/threonine-protein kinase [Roseisolibacter sp. H3M3-2]
MSGGSGADPRWPRAAARLHAALERAPAERDAFLAASCPDDPALRAEVASLLAAHEGTGALDRLAVAVRPLVDGLRPPAPELEGRTVGAYVVGARIGGGGMGVVHRAHDVRLDRTVAVKFLQPHLGADPVAAERFALEARTVAALEHPNICTVHEVGATDDGALYLVMPLYEGETLQARLARGPLPTREAAAVAVQMLRGLAKAHARGVVHRDVKPSNVLLTPDGVVKLLDFGVAKLADVTLTGAQGPIGTLAYMSPEAAMGEPVDHRADLWSLGAVLYEMLAGRRPYASGAALAAASAQGRAPEPEPLTRARGDVPAALDRLKSEAKRS